MALSVVAIKAAKGRAKPYKLTDSDGLYLLVAPNGARYWRMNYRHLGKQKTLAFGVWPDTGLADARAQRDAARKVLARGDDPAEKIKLERIAATVAASNSFKAVADEWLIEGREGRPLSRHHEEAALAAGLHPRLDRQAPDRVHLRAGAADHAAQDGEQGSL